MTISSYGYRLRDRLFPVLTAAIALLWAWAAVYVADYVGTMNTARAIGALMAPGAGLPFIPGAFNTPPSAAPPTPIAQRRQLNNQIATVEIVTYIWRRAMLVVGILLELAAILSAITARVRLWHLIATTLILASTAATLVGLWLLIQPQWGGMPPLSQITYILTAAVQSVYGIVLLIAFARKPSFGRTVRVISVEHPGSNI
jgi:hypothetical protein